MGAAVVVGDAPFREDVSHLLFELEQRAPKPAVLDDELAAGLLVTAGNALSGEGLPRIRGSSESSGPESPVRRRCRSRHLLREPIGMYTLTYWEAIGEQNDMVRRGLAGRRRQVIARDAREVCQGLGGTYAWVDTGVLGVVSNAKGGTLRYVPGCESGRTLPGTHVHEIIDRFAEPYDFGGSILRFLDCKLHRF